VKVCAVILAAGEGRRLRPLTTVRPKALCPVGNVPLLDRALAAVAGAGFTGPESLAVNASWLAGQVVSHVDDRAHLSVEPDGPLGTAGGLGRLRDWIDGRAVLVGNADAYLTGGGPQQLLDGWDGQTVRLLGVPGQPAEFGSARFAGFSLLPWEWVANLRPEPSDLVREVWRPAERDLRLEVVPHDGGYLDTGTPALYLAANLDAAGPASLVDPTATIRDPDRIERSVIGAGAVVHGGLTRSVVWPGGYVGPDEHLVDTIRAGRDLTVPTR